MDDLYTKLMKWVMPFLQAHWQLTIIGFGALFLLGGIFNWKWTWDPDGYKVFGFHAFVYQHFGEKGARIHISITGTIIILCGTVLWVLM